MCMAGHNSRQAMVDLSTNTSIHPFFAQPSAIPNSEHQHLPQPRETQSQLEPSSPSQYSEANVSKRRRLDSSCRDTTTSSGRNDYTDTDATSPTFVLRGHRDGPLANIVENGDTTDEAQPAAITSRALRLDGKGGLGNPEAREQSRSNGSVGSRATAHLGHKKSREAGLCVRISYGQRDLQQRIHIGQKVNQILSSAAPQKDDETSSSQREPGSTAVHPFFNRKLPKREQGSTPAAPALRTAQQGTLPNTRIKSFTNPHLPLRKAQQQDVVTRFERSPAFRGAYRLPGTTEALWPPRGCSRFSDSPVIKPNFPGSNLLHGLGARRSKMRAVHTKTEHDLLDKQCRKLQGILNGLASSDKAREAPKRLVLTNKELQQDYINKPRMQHPALSRLWSNLAFSLSPFDEGHHSSVSWCQKYAPLVSGDVLGNEKEVASLRLWLQAQAVDAVASELSTSKSDNPKHRRKRRKRKDDLDDFIVSDDNVDDTPDDNLSIIDTTIDSNTTSSRQGNIIILSGEHGVGKSAAIQAVARELDFSIFEINAGTRRSGKDLLDRVGDLARNHQVRNHSTEHSTSFSAGMPEGTQQKSVKTFFNSGTKPGSSMKQRKSSGAADKQKHSSQKQALILLEEADVLFEEDKQFWETLSSLAEQSRRPIIITCNDEQLVHASDIQPYGVLRFYAPTLGIVTEYLRLVAAAEGHLVDPSAIANLYGARRHDLRATIQDLNFWCQMAIGDTKGGMDWMLNGWPRAANVNEAGERLRVISDGTFSLGILSSIQLQRRQESLDNLRITPVHTPESDHTYSVDDNKSTQKPSPSCELDLIADMLSSTDIFPSTDLRNMAIDTTVAPLSDSIRQQYTEGYRLLEGQEDQYSTGVGTSYSASIVLLLDRLKPSRPRHEGASLSTKYLRHPTSGDLFDSWKFSVSRASMALDYLPYLRSIAAYDLALERLHSDAHQNDGRVSKLRTTRAARSALEGGDRKTTRRARWLPLNTNLQEIMDTGAAEWTQALLAGECSPPQPSPTDSTDAAS